MSAHCRYVLGVRGHSARWIMETHRSVCAVGRTLIGESLCLVFVLFAALGMICPVAKAQDCPQCVASDPPEPPLPTGLWLMTTHVNGVNVLFIAAHKGGASLSDLSRDDILVRDDNKPPAAVLGFRTEHELALRVGVAIYTISTNYGSARPDDPTWDNVHAGDNNLRKLAEQSGGRMLRPQSPSEVAKAFAKIGEELRSRYSVSYKPADFTPDGHYRRIKIEAHKLGEKFEIRARKGYFARSVSSLSADSSTVAGGAILASR